MNPVILFRSFSGVEDEKICAEKYFKIIDSRVKIQKNDLVICRYSYLPFPIELELDIKFLGGRLINSYQEHLFAADLQNWVGVLQELTPKTWDNIQDIPDNMSFVLKGETNSRKNYWKTMMFAENKEKAKEVYFRLQDDGLIGQQKVYIREYVPLKTHLLGVQGMPVSHEFRVFVYRKHVASVGFYWSNYLDDLPNKPDINDIPPEFLREVIDRVGDNISFYAVDVAQTQSGEWIVIEVNDGTCSGLSDNNPDILYSNLKSIIQSYE